MCELFAVSSDQPIRIRYELRAFARRGGGKFRNRDGWGIMFAQHRDAYLFKEPAAASESPLERLVATHAPPARLVIAHVRLATAGGADVLDIPVGTFRKGMKFDALAIDTAARGGTVRRLDGDEDPEAALQRILFTASKRNIADVWIGGRHVAGSSAG